MQRMRRIQDAPQMLSVWNGKTKERVLSNTMESKFEKKEFVWSALETNAVVFVDCVMGRKSSHPMNGQNLMENAGAKIVCRGNV